MDTNYQVTVAVLTYHPKQEKLFATLRSILLQKDIRFQIVIADDGSPDPLAKETETFFAKAGFTDYVLVHNLENQGTVCNVISAVQRSAAPYIKLISPGDMLGGETMLAQWVQEASRRQAGLSFCDSVYYYLEDGKPCPTSGIAHPQNVRCYLRQDFEKARYNYLVLHDLFLGASILCKRVLLLAYLNEIRGKAIYAEDHAYRIMAYDRVPVYYFPKAAVIYEFGTGISTNGNTVWLEKLYKDARACTKIIMERPIEPGDKTAITYRYLELEAKSDLLSKVRKFLRVRGLLMGKLKPKWMYRKTKKELPTDFLQKVFGEYM